MASLFGATAEQLAIRETALSFAREKLAAMAAQWDRDKHFPVGVLREAAALGFAAINAREEFGGVGLSRLDSVIIFEALATGCPSIAAYLSVHNMCAWMIDTFGSEPQRRAFLPRLCAMDSFASYCLTEAGSGSDAAALRARAERRGEEYVLNGEKQFISGAGASGPDHLYIVMARTGGEGTGGISALLSKAERRVFRSAPRKERWVGTRSRPTR